MNALRTPDSVLVRRIHAASALFAVLLVAILVMRTSQAAFTATHDNEGNTFTADSIQLVGNDSGDAMFTVTDMTPGQIEVRCISIEYIAGASTADVTLYGDVVSGDLGQYLDLVIEYEDDASLTDGQFPDCNGFDADGTAYNGTLAGFAATHTNFANGAASWAVEDGDTRVYRFTATLQDEDDAQGETVEANFTWEAQTN